MDAPLWPAPRAYEPVCATVRVPGSKSVTNRALVTAALAERPSRLSAPLRARDTELMRAGLGRLGTGIDERGEEWTITPEPLRGPARIDVGLAGTVMRFLPPVAGLANGRVAFEGDPQASARPLGPLLGALRTLGIGIDDGARGGLPFVVHGRGGIRGGSVSIDASASSQFVSGLLLAAARFDAGLELRHHGGPLPSLPHIAMTVAMLRDAGVGVDHSEPARWRVSPGPIRGVDILIEPDLSNAAVFLAAAVLTAGEVTVPDWPEHSTQPGAALPGLLQAYGARAFRTDAGLTVRGTGRVHGVDLDLHDVGELTPVLAALGAVADSPSRLRGVAHLRGHETDRLAALRSELTGLGCRVDETEDGLHIQPGALHGGTFASYHDHRMAQAGALLGLVVDGVLVENIATTGKTLPGFETMWRDMLAGTQVLETAR